MIEVIERSRIGVGPAVKIPFTPRGDRPKLGLLATGGDHKLIEIKERWASFACDTTLLAVAQHLVDGLGDGVLHLGRLAFNQDHGQAIHEQHNVRDNVVLGAQDADLELAHGNKAVFGAVLEVDKAYRRAILACLSVLTDAGVLQKQMKNVLVVLDQSGAGEIRGELPDDFFDLVVCQPRIDDCELFSQYRQHDDFGKVLSKRISGLLLPVGQVDDLPAQAV